MADLSDLKPGDEVAVVGYAIPVIAKIERISPSGRISLSGENWTYDKHGNAIRARGTKTRLERVTDAHRESLLIDAIQCFRFKPSHLANANLATLRKVESLLDEARALLAKEEDDG